MSTTRFDAIPIILFPFLSITKLFVAKVPSKSKKCIESPKEGDAGKVTVTIPTEVLTNSPSFATAV